MHNVAEHWNLENAEYGSPKNLAPLSGYELLMKWDQFIKQ
jgi:hypothetical protein